MWMQALREMCRNNGVFLPTYLINDMTASDLELASMAPYKWRSQALEKCEIHLPHHLLALQGAPAPIFAGDVLEYRLQLEDHFDNNSTLYLVPGGRYLIATSDGGTLIWDLGFSACGRHAPGYEPRIVAAAEFPDNHVNCFQPSSDGLGIYLLKHRNAEEYGDDDE